VGQARASVTLNAALAEAGATLPESVAISISESGGMTKDADSGDVHVVLVPDTVQATCVPELPTRTKKNRLLPAPGAAESLMLSDVTFSGTFGESTLRASGSSLVTPAPLM
jgi:hypothetical protein